MPNVILQPAGKGAAAVHYRDTIVHPVPLARIERFISQQELSLLKGLFPTGAAQVWGVTPGEDDRNRARWVRIGSGDVALFAGEGRVFSYATVVAKFHNPSLASELWGEDEDGDTWEYLYFLNEAHDVNIPYDELRKAIGYKPGYIVRGFEVLGDDKSDLVLALVLASTANIPINAELSDAVAAVKREGSFDPLSVSDARKKALTAIVQRQGQPQFRKKLLDAYENRCAISDADAVAALEAAHIVAYKGTSTNHISNGLLLRSDLHTLFDLGLIAVKPENLTVAIAAQLEKTSYALFKGAKLRIPKNSHAHPSLEALKLHFEGSQVAKSTKATVP